MKSIVDKVLKESEDYDYKKWKRQNVTIRGVKELGQANGGFASFGSGLYTAFLSNKQMAKEYGKVYFVVNAKPKNPKVVRNVNEAEIFLQNLINSWCKQRGLNYDTSAFYKETQIAPEMLKLGYDGLVIKGREMVNYNPPSNVAYFETEKQLYNYWLDHYNESF